MAELVVGNCPSQELALTNKAFVSPATAERIGAGMVEVGSGYDAARRRGRGRGRCPRAALTPAAARAHARAHARARR